MMLEQTAIEFIEQLSSKEPVPGGGGAAALVGALSGALGQMVCNLTIGKKKYAFVEEEVITILEEIENHKKKLIHLVDEDAAGFLPLSKAYGMPVETLEQKQEKQEVMEVALRTACEAPMAMMEEMLHILMRLEFLAKNGSTLAVSDVGAAALLGQAALETASLNIFINTKAMTDEYVKEEFNHTTRRMIQRSKEIRDVVCSLVDKKIGK
ncbi:formiminotetrahydrofolate cyclodeaminase [Lachnospiraceae bacterium PF1-21]|uniref:Cyclodeaminase/cyclohydrolase family protein n=1 Tax=Ohessyouella blattaphilus TaxID=2949333 RepID=A0ABT1EH80_9FIRM|nr:cyclodeaminase/cyclohydrolase family protein [Ohessyouella blattaphilus]MCP1109051.1 cyclodeaminase/cyclohydrolase family protein [Ohessyouella blattaphilus]MCR8562445.1 cyclodeaminase/cyclohydrolase family protein [Ohessyouella blattaphilus]